MTTENAPRKSTFITETGDGYSIEASVKGFVDTDSETYASEVLAIADHLFRDVFASDFTEQILDMYEHRFQARIDAAAEPTEFDQGWAAGRQAALLEAEQDKIEPENVPDEGMVGKILEVTDRGGAHGFEPGTRVHVVHVDEDDDGDTTPWLATTRADVLPYGENWVDAWASGVTAWVGPDNTKPWVDGQDES